MKRLLLCISICSILISCSESDNFKSSESNFYALKKGNSWVYKSFRLNSETDEYDYIGVIDSISVIGKEEILGETYFKVRTMTIGNESNIAFCNSNGERFELLREEQGNLIDDKGAIIFTNNNFEELLLWDRGLHRIYEKLNLEKSKISVEAGVFECFFKERYGIDNNGVKSKGLDKFYYSDGIGLVYDTSSYYNSLKPVIIRRLQSYNLN
jgi:hypothetical protein